MTARAKYLEMIARNPRWVEAPRSGKGFVIGGGNEVGITEYFMLKEAEEARFEEVRAWTKRKLGRAVTDAEVEANWDECELDEAYQHALDKDD